MACGPRNSRDAKLGRRTLAALVVGAFAIRILAVLVLKTYTGGAGAYEHAEIASSLVRGEGFAFNFFDSHPIPSSHQAPAIPLVLAAAFRALGEGTPHAYLAVEVVNCLLGAAGVLAAARIAAASWGRRAGMTAGILSAIYPPLIYMCTRVQAVNWSVNFLLLGIWSIMAARDRPTAARSVAAGACWGLGILGEPILLAPTVAALAYLLARGRPRAAAIAFAALAVILAPWLVRNAVVHKQVVLVKSTFWYVFWQGNHLEATGTDKTAIAPDVARQLAWRIPLSGLERALEAARGQAKSVDEHIPPEALARIRAMPTEVAKMSWFRSESIRTLRDDPAHYLRMCARRTWQLVWFDPTNPRSYPLTYRLPYLVLLVAGVVGAGLALRQAPRSLDLVAMTGGALVVVHVLVITSARFRLPLEALLILPASLLVSRVIAGCICGGADKREGT